MKTVSGGPRRSVIVVTLAIIIALTLLNGVFAGAEIAVVSMRRTRMVELLD